MKRFDWNYSTSTGAWVFNVLTGEILFCGLTKRKARKLAQILNQG